MPVIVDATFRASPVEVLPLNQRDFAQFGTVIENPDPARASVKNGPLPSNAVRANQGTALKYQNVTNMLDLYSSAPSKVSSKAAMNMFVCTPRDLEGSIEEEVNSSTLEGTFPVDILERHPFTTQTFIPLGLSAADAENTCYLVIVAPSNPASLEDEHLPVPQYDVTGHRLPGRGLPNLMKLRAFIAKGTQAVTYGAGTWHAPMVVVGKKAIDFVVVQFANGVEAEDCQEVMLRYPDSRAAIRVAVRGIPPRNSQSGVPKL